jgi:acyl carrier protein
MTDTVANNEQVRQIIADHLCTDDGATTPEASLIDDLGADSLDAVEITLAVEQAFVIRVSDDEAETCLTVGDWQQIVERKLA